MLSPRKLFLTAAIALCVSALHAQTVYEVPDALDADVKVYVTDNTADADLVVYKTQSQLYAEGNKGLWYFTSNDLDAKKKIYFVDSKLDADMVVCFTDDKLDAGWRNKSKRHLMY